MELVSLHELFSVLYPFIFVLRSPGASNKRPRWALKMHSDSQFKHKIQKNQTSLFQSLNAKKKITFQFPKGKMLTKETFLFIYFQAKLNCILLIPMRTFRFFKSFHLVYYMHVLAKYIVSREIWKQRFSQSPFRFCKISPFFTFFVIMQFKILAKDQCYGYLLSNIYFIE